MISFGFVLQNPWNTKFKNLWSRAYSTPFKNKFIELEAYRYSHIVSFNINWTVREDHAGLNLEVGLFGIGIRFNLYDNRHWDYKDSRYRS